MMHPEWTPEMLAAVNDHDRMPVWVFYDKPSDFPEHVVARLWFALPANEPTLHVLTAPTLEEVSAKIPGADQGRWYPIARLPADDPTIIGTWI